MKIKRIIAVLLALITIFALVGCGKTRRPIVKLTLNSEDAVAILAAAGITLPEVEDITCANTTVKWYSGWDNFHNYSEEEVVNSGYWVFSEKYGCEVEWIEYTWNDRFTTLATLVSSNNSPDFYEYTPDVFPNYVMKGLFQAVNDYVDYTDPLWAGTADMAKAYTSLGDNYYAFVLGSRLKNPMVYNRRVMEEYGYEDPAELYYNGEWTWDVFLDMCIDFSDADTDHYALDGFWWDNALMRSSGVEVITYDVASGTYVENLDDPRLERAVDVISELQKNDCIYPLWDKSWKARGNVNGGGIKDGLALFWVIPNFGDVTLTVEEMSQIWGDMEAQEVMFVPMPRDPQGDGIHYQEASLLGYALIAGAKNPEGVGLIAACDRFKALDPTVIAFDKRELMNKYLWTAEMFDMKQEFQTLVDAGYSVMPAGGVSDKLSAAASATGNLGRSGVESTSWAQIKESYAEQIKYYLEEFNYEVEAYIAGLAA